MKVVTKTVTEYVSADGKVFSTRKACNEHEFKTLVEPNPDRLVQYWKDRLSSAVAEYMSQGINRKFWRRQYETSVVEIKRITRTKGGFSQEDLRDLEDYAAHARKGLFEAASLADTCKTLRDERDFCARKLKEARKALKGGNDEKKTQDQQ